MTPEVQRHPKRAGWYKVPFGSSDQLWGVPGTYFDDGLIIAHQTHLPLLDPALVAKHLAQNAQTSNAWAERDAWCAERGFKLRTTQHQAIDFAWFRRSVLLCDEQRLGKTGSALMMDAQWRQMHKARIPYGPLLIIAPLSTRAVWLSWARRLHPELEIGVIAGKTFKPETLRKPIVFGHYDVIHKWQGIFDVGTLILDEVQGLTNPSSLRTKAAALLSCKARHVVALTGTPINRFPPDMFAVLDILASGAWGSNYDFCQRYGNPTPTGHGTKYDGISNEVELKARLSEIMLRRLWRDCHADLPPITRSVVIADLSLSERNKLDVLAGKIKADRQGVAANLAAYRRQVSTFKLATVLKEIERVLDRGEPVVVWTWHKEFAEKIAARLRDRAAPLPAWVIHGEVQIAERERRMAEWRAHPCGTLVANMAVAGAGIDLSHAHIAIFAEIDWTPAVIGQAEMRTYWPERPMDILFVIANHLVDQRIVRSLVAKLSASDPLGVAAAIDAIDALRDVVLGPTEEGDLDRLLADLLASG
jgi:superfamily II DNA or RNA helicase